MIIFIIIFLALVWVAFAFISGWFAGLISKVIDAIFAWFEKEFENFQQSQREKPISENADPFVQYEEEKRRGEETLIQVRQSVAQAIATHRQLEEQIQNNIKLAETWRNRAAMALENNNRELADQAEQRCKQYENAAEFLQAQLAKSALDTSKLRYELTTLERRMGELHARHQALQSRQATADAKIQLNEFFAKLLAQYAEAQNKKAEEKLHGIIDRMPAALLVVNKEGKILAVNPQLEKLAGHPSKEICESMTISQLFEHGEEKDVMGRLNEVADKGICGANLRISDGRYVQVEVSVSHLQSGDLIICIFETGSKQSLF